MRRAWSLMSPIVLLTLWALSLWLITLAYLLASAVPSDDAQAFYTTGLAFWSHTAWYTYQPPNLNPPPIAWLWAPLARLSLPTAILVWNTLALGLLVDLARRIAQAARVSVWWILPLLCLQSGVLASVRFAQYGIPVAWVLTLAWQADREDRPIAAGAWAALALPAVPPAGILYGCGLLAWWAVGLPAAPVPTRQTVNTAHVAA